MKKTVFGWGAVLALVVVLSGCSGTGNPPPKKVTVTITGLNRSETWSSGASYFSLSVFREDAVITEDSRALTRLGGAGKVAESFMVSTPTATSISFELAEFPAGQYVLVLGASASMNSGEDAAGAMVITGSGGARAAAAVDFSSAVSMTSFITNSGNGWQADAIRSTFANP
ncbi:MAG: hypothetical protein LBD31_03385 [Treponema sp.]|jgi:hypothetical protein|nr:hypothetical protein [Treponema sp.]